VPVNMVQPMLRVTDAAASIPIVLVGRHFQPIVTWPAQFSRVSVAGIACRVKILPGGQGNIKLSQSVLGSWSSTKSFGSAVFCGSCGGNRAPQSVVEVDFEPSEVVGAGPSVILGHGGRLIIRVVGCPFLPVTITGTGGMSTLGSA
jgi:hypothetical protein